MIGIGYGSQTSATKSHSPRSATASSSSPMTSRMNGRSRLAAAGVKAGATSRRTRACSSPSIERIDGRRCSKSESWTPCICGMSDRAEWNRRSRRRATTSA